jgi:holo-[acyl-carrier protein] synthase
VIAGLGLDVVGVARIRAARARHPQRFLERVYTPAEQAYCLGFADPDERFAARWAAKEAAMKALGTGGALGVTFTDIEVLPGAGGAPAVSLSGAAATRAAALGVTRSLVSLSHSDGLAIAVVVLEA